MHCAQSAGRLAFRLHSLREIRRYYEHMQLHSFPFFKAASLPYCCFRLLLMLRCAGLSNTDKLNDCQRQLVVRRRLRRAVCTRLAVSIGLRSVELFVDSRVARPIAILHELLRQYQFLSSQKWCFTLVAKHIKLLRA